MLWNDSGVPGNAQQVEHYRQCLLQRGVRHPQIIYKLKSIDCRHVCLQSLGRAQKSRGQTYGNQILTR